ncbi:MAG: hypothetical protein N4Q18_09730, partial [Lactobacillus crispatus]|nr:hypothetical protein [Lactobacillus crispatus]
YKNSINLFLDLIKRLLIVRAVKSDPQKNISGFREKSGIKTAETEINILNSSLVLLMHII